MLVPLLLPFAAADVAAAAPASRPDINVLGTYDLLLVETTPLVIKGELYLFESVRPDYWDNDYANGTEYLRFVHMLSGKKTSNFGHGHALGCAHAEDGAGGGRDGVYAFGTQQKFGAELQGDPSDRAVRAGRAGAVPAALPGQVISMFSSADSMQTWQTKTAIDFSKEASPSRKKRVVFNTSVGKGVVNGTVAWVMAYEHSVPSTPGGWNTNFAISYDLESWRLLDEDTFAMPLTVEHADPTIRYVKSDGYWCDTLEHRPRCSLLDPEIHRADP
jgi:hypothetical protein